MEKQVSKIKQGDRFVENGYTHWTAIENATDEGAYIVVPVQFGDGGLGQRIWDDPSITIEVENGEA